MIETLAESLVVGIAAFRLWHLLAIDQIAQPIRERLPERAWVQDMWSCPWCLTVYLSVILWALWTYLPTIGQPTILILAATAVAGLIGDHL